MPETAFIAFCLILSSCTSTFNTTFCYGKIKQLLGMLKTQTELRVSNSEYLKKNYELKLEHWPSLLLKFVRAKIKAELLVKNAKGKKGIGKICEWRRVGFWIWKWRCDMKISLRSIYIADGCDSCEKSRTKSSPRKWFAFPLSQKYCFLPPYFVLTQMLLARLHCLI